VTNFDIFSDFMTILATPFCNVCSISIQLIRNVTSSTGVPFFFFGFQHEFNLVRGTVACHLSLTKLSNSGSTSHTSLLEHLQIAQTLNLDRSICSKTFKPPERISLNVNISINSASVTTSLKPLISQSKLSTSLKSPMIHQGN
jgi:hypothetical protein